jgi:hypothetical protein
MSTLKINVRPIEAFEVTNDKGETIAVVRVKERWQGMAQLVTDDGQSLIVDDPSTFAVQFGKAFAQIFGGDTRSTFALHLIKASPELAARLGVSREGAKP